MASNQTSTSNGTTSLLNISAYVRSFRDPNDDILATAATRNIGNGSAGDRDTFIIVAMMVMSVLLLFCCAYFTCKCCMQRCRDRTKASRVGARLSLSKRSSKTPSSRSTRTTARWAEQMDAEMSIRTSEASPSGSPSHKSVSLTVLDVELSIRTSETAPPGSPSHKSVSLSV
eukprot:6172618-Pleurochrysis_carterae.AAC.2